MLPLWRFVWAHPTAGRRGPSEAAVAPPVLFVVTGATHFEEATDADAGATPALVGVACSLANSCGEAAVLTAIPFACSKLRIAPPVLGPMDPSAEPRR